MARLFLIILLLCLCFSQARAIDVILQGNGDGSLWEVPWRYTDDNTTCSSVAGMVTDNTSVYYLTWCSSTTVMFLSSFDIDTGALNWTNNITPSVGYVFYNAAQSIPNILYDNSSIYVAYTENIDPLGIPRGQIKKYLSSTGALVWGVTQQFFFYSDRFTGSAVDDTGIYFSSGETPAAGQAVTRKYTKDNGTVVWSYTYPTNAVSGGPLMSDNSLYLYEVHKRGTVPPQQSQRIVYALRLDNGSLGWSTAISDMSDSYPYVFDGFVYIGGKLSTDTNKSKISYLSAVDGTEISSIVGNTRAISDLYVNDSGIFTASTELTGATANIWTVKLINIADNSTAWTFQSTVSDTGGSLSYIEYDRTGLILAGSMSADLRGRFERIYLSDGSYVYTTRILP